MNNFKFISNQNNDKWVKLLVMRQVFLDFNKKLINMEMCYYVIFKVIINIIKKKD